VIDAKVLLLPVCNGAEKLNFFIEDHDDSILEFNLSLPEHAITKKGILTFKVSNQERTLSIMIEEIEFIVDSKETILKCSYTFQCFERVMGFQKNKKYKRQLKKNKEHLLAEGWCVSHDKYK